MWALGNIAGNGSECREFTVRCGIIQPLIGLITRTIGVSECVRVCVCVMHSLCLQIQHLRNVTWTLSNLCRNKNPPPSMGAMQQVRLSYHLLYSLKLILHLSLSLSHTHTHTHTVSLPFLSLSLVSLYCTKCISLSLCLHPLSLSLPPLPPLSQILPALAHLIHHEDREVVSDTCWALSYLTDTCTERIQAVLDSDILTKLVQLLGSSEISCVVRVGRGCVCGVAVCAVVCGGRGMHEVCLLLSLSLSLSLSFSPFLPPSFLSSFSPPPTLPPSLSLPP